MATSLTEIAGHTVAWDEGTKAIEYYKVYDRYFADFADRPATILELGVYHGQSTKVFASYFAAGKVIAVDSADRKLDFSAFPNIVFELGDQRSAEQLRDICARHAPHGIDIVIDDAAHIGAWSLASYRTLLPLLNPGGFYVVEDWGTGYWGDWPDGREFRPASRLFPRASRRRIQSHDFGMVGFVKSLVDDVSVDIAPTRAAARTRVPQLEFVHTYPRVAVAKKRQPEMKPEV